MFTAYANYWDFHGRANRSEYWLFALWVFLLAVGAGLVDVWVLHQSGLFGPCGLFVAFANLIPNLSLAVRRLHDTGRSGWWLLAYALPLLGGGALFVFSLLPGTPGENPYGPQPGKRDHEDLQATFA
jgi:uncharacterized membrane protein YhaH (DUF805 family)